MAAGGQDWIVVVVVAESAEYYQLSLSLAISAVYAESSAHSLTCRGRVDVMVGVIVGRIREGRLWTVPAERAREYYALLAQSCASLKTKVKGKKG